MADEKINENNSKQANVEDTIQILKGEQKGKKGTVLSVLENSVIVQLGGNTEKGEPIKTVVNHKNYKRM